MSADMQAMAPEPVWVRIREASPMLGNTPQSTLRRLAATGQIPARKVGGRWLLRVSWIQPEEQAS